MKKSEKFLDNKNRYAVSDKELTKKEKRIIDSAVKRVIKEHVEALRLFGRG